MAFESAKPARDPHPELSAPIIDLSLEARISLAEQAVVDRDARVRSDVDRIVDDLRSKRGALVKVAAISGAAALALGAGYAGYRALRERRPTARLAQGDPERLSLAAELAAFAGVATQWALRLERGQGFLGTLFGAVRKSLWPSASGAAAQTRSPEDAAGPHAPEPSTRDDRKP